MRTSAALISTAALVLTLAACSDGSGDSGSPADSATASSSAATTAPPADAEAIRACMDDVRSLFNADWSPTTPPETRPPACESLSVTDYGYAYRSSMDELTQDAEDAYNDIIENGGLPTAGGS